MLRVGLTGGIGSGKSTVAALFAALGTPVIDTDEIAHALAEPGQPAYNEIVRVFGEFILDVARRIDRKKLRERVFANPTERIQLEAILHPRIRDAVHSQLNQLHLPYCILVVPLLIEAGFGDLVDRVLVVDADEAQQIQRTMQRSGLSAAEVHAIMTAQSNRRERLQRADDVIENCADATHLAQQVAQWHAQYLSLAAADSLNPPAAR